MISNTLLTQLAIFGCVAAAVWALMEFLGGGGKSRAEERLDEFSDTRSKGRTNAPKSDSMTRLIEAASPKLSAPLKPKTAEEASKLKLRLQHAGYRSENAVSIFLGMKFLCLVLGFFASGGSMLYLKGFTLTAMMYTVAISGIMMFLPDVVVWLRKKSRQDCIFYGLPDALDLMVVCVEAGLGLDQAMRKVSEEMQKSYAVLSEEFRLANLQLQMGAARNSVLHELGQRTGVDDLKALAAILIQADKFGSSVAQALRVQSDSMRTRRQQMAEEKAAKTAVKLIFPLVIFIFPAIFVVLVGPAAITMINEMFPAMQGAQ
ncbi:type II secretion system F family protein [Aeoliella mucimassa]|uniref:Bacterial type II secretion system protein F domain protein n=1 Tax=Aeoliella mucimassa TaxID=2527972 RepID=A0A518AJJ3_9BACT|nr:type II secretion system F family protein [Aeoliella mucimassa]QDU54908.1 Bacterial type II secretion system protein F domain protein [Aeoliella mucimassa]